MRDLLLKIKCLQFYKAWFLYLKINAVLLYKYLVIFDEKAFHHPGTKIFHIY